MKGFPAQIRWPVDIPRLGVPLHSPNLSSEQLAQLQTRPPAEVPRIKLTETSAEHVDIRQITSPSHPAHGQYGLFANRHLEPDELVTVYLGLVHGESEADVAVSSKSDYDISLDRDIGVAIDAASCGNEGRFVNDYRGVPRNGKGVSASGPNAEFRDIWIEYVDSNDMPVEERAIGVFVLGAGKSGKRKGGIEEDDEILVSYGRGFWEERKKEQASRQAVPEV